MIAFPQYSWWARLRQGKHCQLTTRASCWSSGSTWAFPQEGELRHSLHPDAESGRSDFVSTGAWRWPSSAPRPAITGLREAGTAAGAQ